MSWENSPDYGSKPPSIGWWIALGRRAAGRGNALAQRRFSMNGRLVDMLVYFTAAALLAVNAWWVCFG